MRIKVCYIVSKINKALAFEWICEKIDHNKFELSFILLTSDNNTELEKYLVSNSIQCSRISLSSKKDYPTVFLRVYKKLKKERPSIIHCHLFDATIIGLSAARFLRIRKRVFTRHHSTYNHEYVKKMVYFDRLCNKLATHIIAISENVKNVLVEMENVNEKKVSLIHHGFHLSKFENVEESEVNKLRLKYDLNESAPVIGVISRYLELKGIQYVIRAFKKFRIKSPNAILVLANAQGPFSKEIRVELKQIPKSAYREISFENDIFNLYACLDAFIHVPINRQVEAFGQTYVESLAAGIPSIFTLSGIANEFIENGRNAIVVDYKSADDIYLALKCLLLSEFDKNELIDRGKKDVQMFGLGIFMNKLAMLYES